MLVSSLRDIRGPLVPSATPHHDGSVVAWNMSFNANLSLANAIVRSNDLSLPIGVQKENIDFVREKYFVLEEKMKLHGKSCSSAALRNTFSSQKNYFLLSFLSIFIIKF